MKKLLPIISLILGLGAGGAAAIVFSPADDPFAEVTDEHSEHAAEDTEESNEFETEIVKLPNQFVVPVILEDRVRAMVILTVALETKAGLADQVRLLEPKLRDMFLAELFNLAALDGFRDEIISRRTLELVKDSLTVQAQKVLKTDHVTVLITDMARQDAF